MTTKDFIQDLIKLIGPKNDPPPALQEKVLNLIQSWADAFRSQPDLSGVYHIYLDLKAKGIEFPAQDLDSMAPIHTPQRSVTQASPPRSSVSSSTATPSRTSGGNERPRPPTLEPIRLTPEQLVKLKEDLTIVEGNITVHDDMLNEMTPGEEHPDDWELLLELNKTCRAMQRRVMDLIDTVLNEDATIELLRVNDDLNNSLSRFDRFCKRKSKSPSSPINHSAQPQFPQSRPQESLIDLDDLLGPTSAASASAEPQLLTNFANLAVAAGKPKLPGRPTSSSGDEFDALAHSRSSGATNGSSTAYAVGAASAGDQVDSSLGSLAQSRPLRDLEGAGLIDKKEDLDEMEKWLMEQESGATTAAPTTTTTTVDNSDFERFLYERAAAADGLPTAGQTSQDKKKSDPFGL